jgi:hypothetical protein
MKGETKMLVKEITYKDYDGNERKETAMFNLSKAELLEMELSTTGGLEQYINKIVSTQNGPELFKLFKELILKSYGEKSPDGKRFIKSDQLSEEFSQSPAFSELMMELISDAEKCAAFVKGIVPSDLGEAVEKNNVVALPENK